MKTVGTTDNGQHLVEMSRAELKAIQLLIQVADGQTMHEFDRDMYTAAFYEKDVAILLNAVSEWVQVASRANELRHLADRIDMALKMPESEETK